MKYYIGIDLGGTNIASGLVDENGKVTEKISVPTDVKRGSEAILNDIADLCKRLCKNAGITMSEIEKIGIGIPGTIDTKNGVIMYSCNLPFDRTEIVKIISEKCSRPVKILNDADAAAYGEYIVSEDKPESFVCITLGTGIGAGIIIDGKIYNGFNGAGAELGHTTLIKGGVKCSCGRSGCWEKYASASALVAQTEEAIEKHPESIMAKADKVNGQTAFRAMDEGDKCASEVVENYIEYVAEGLLNVINTFQPQRIVIGGGISHEGEPFIGRVRDYVDKFDYNKYLPKTTITAAKLFNDAGIVGAALC